MQIPTRHVVSINDLTNAEIESVFETANKYLKELGDAKLGYRIARSTDVASAFVSASLFYEPSTRTRLSFESAMLRLGGRTITSADPHTSSAAKGESLADTVRVLSNYADLLVIRHPRDGAARLAAEYATVPVINGGDGSHEHPTQTLCDLFTLQKERGSLKDLKVAISGDLRGSRTVHSFVYALARFRAAIQPLPAPGMELPPHVDERLREEFNCQLLPPSKLSPEAATLDALYVTPDQPHQPSLFPGEEAHIAIQYLRGKKLDAIYVTRFQKERWKDKESDYPKIDRKFLQSPEFSEASVLHPLPRVGELDSSLDGDSRAKYFQQAAYGVPIRMALISLILGITGHTPLERYVGGFVPPRHTLYRRPRGEGIECHNPNCIAREISEQPYVENRFFLVPIGSSGRSHLRCFYCESDIDEFVVANRRRKWFSTENPVVEKTNTETLKDQVFFASEDDARQAGFHARRPSPEERRSGGLPI